MTKILFTLLISTFYSFSAFSNDPYEGNAVLKGKITTSEGSPAAYVTVQINELKRSAVTNEEGLYMIKGIPSGTYTVQVSLIGYQTAKETVSINDRSTVDLSIALSVSGDKLEEIRISSGRRKFVRPSSDYAARMPLKNIENPQVYSTITSELLREQMTVSFDDALKNAPGIDKLWSSTGRGGDGAAYFSLRGFALQPSMVNGVAGISNGGLDPANIERIEVIKGPSGTLFGSSLVSFGGLINLVTKKPFNTSKGEISYTTGSFGLNRLTLDYNTLLNSSGKTLFRINGSVHSEKSWQDAGFRRSVFIAPSLLHKLNDRMTIHLNMEYFNAEQTNPLMVFLNRTRPLVATDINSLKFDFKRSYTSNDITIQTPTFNIYGQASYKISDKWTSQTNFASSTRKSDGYYSYIMFILPGDSLLNRYVSDQNSVSHSRNFQQNFIGDFRIGKMRNRVVAGIDVLHLETDNNNSAYILFDTVNSRKVDPKYTNLNEAALALRFGQTNNLVKTNLSNYTYGAYFSNVLDITDRLNAMVSLRLDHFDNKGTYNLRTEHTTGAFSQTTLSPKLGAVYQLIKNKVSAFANYMNGFRNTASVTQPDGTVSNFKPQQANQWEAGLKMDLFGGWLNGSVSYYDILVSNVTRPDPDRVGFTIQDGNVRSKGFETDLVANLLPGLNLTAGYSFNESINEKTDKASVGRRPVNAGPQHLVNTWISYNLIKGKLKGLGAGFGGNYASENTITNSATTGTFVLPAYTVLNTSVFYETSTVRVGFKIDNLTNRDFYKGWTTIEPQLPRRYSMQLTLKF